MYEWKILFILRTGAHVRYIDTIFSTYMDMINNIVQTMTCLMILAHFFHSQSLIETIMWKHHNNSIMNIMKGKSSIILYMISLTNMIGSSHSNPSVSIHGKFIHDTGLPSQNDKSLLNLYSLMVSSLVSWVELFCQYENDISHVQIVMTNIDIIFLNFIFKLVYDKYDDILNIVYYKTSTKKRLR